jgi:hypothetical protein
MGRRPADVDTSPIPTILPATVTRPRPLIETILACSLREQGPASRTASAWRWVLTGEGLSPVSDTPGPGRPPSLDAIIAEARHDTDPPACAWPPWRHNFDSDPDRQQARRVLRWLTGAADAIPLLAPGRGRHVGARLHLARTDAELRQVRDWVHLGLHENGDLPERIPQWQAERPWQWPASWMNAAWLRGAMAYLNWILGETDIAPLSGQHVLLDPAAILASLDPRVYAGLLPMDGVGHGPPQIEEEMAVWLSEVIMQGHEGQPPTEPGELPPPQWGEGVEQAHDWATGEDAKPPADHHGCGNYYPCPDLLRCTCEAAGHCLRDQCPACTDRICNAAWTSIEENY